MKFELNFRNNVGSDQELIDNLKRVATQISDNNVSTRQYDELGKFSYKAIAKRFGSWSSALEKAGLNVIHVPNISETELFQNLETVWITLGRQPKSREMKQPLSKYTESGYRRKFGSWKKALEAFVEFINSSDDEKIEEKPITPNEVEIEYKHKTKRQPSERLKVQILMRDGNKCKLCGITVTGNDIHFDHIKPWSKGGETILENMQVLCAKHNLAKGDLG